MGASIPKMYFSIVLTVSWVEIHSGSLDLNRFRLEIVVKDFHLVYYPGASEIMPKTSLD
jgi:hypothetical protein